MAAAGYSGRTEGMKQASEQYSLQTNIILLKEVFKNMDESQS
jgi:hypothetical protein